MKKTFAFLLSLLVLGTADAQLKPFNAGDKVAFVGNSITEQGYYESYIWLYYMLHYPKRRITIYNKGIGGDRAKDMYLRFDDDVLPADPNVISLTFGMNDSGYFEFLWANADSSAKAHLAESHLYFDSLQAKLKKLPNVKKIIIIGSPFDATVKVKGNVFPGKIKVMEQIADFQTAAAKENHWGLVDFMHPMTEIDRREQKHDSTFTLTGDDRIHPGNAGHFVMAWLFLKTQGVAGLPVADIAIDAKSGKLGRSENCQITNVRTQGNLRFDYLANSLPFPVDTVARLWGNPRPQSQALGVMPFYTEFNRELMKVTGLSDGQYELTIDNKPVATFTASALSEGINLAKLHNTPEYEQAMSVLTLNEERMALESKVRAYYWLQFDYLRGIGMKFKDNLVAMDSVNAASAKRWDVASKRDNYRAARYPAVRAAWKKGMDLLVDEIYAINQPKIHHVELKRII